MTQCSNYTLHEAAMICPSDVVCFSRKDFQVRAEDGCEGRVCASCPCITIAQDAKLKVVELNPIGLPVNQEDVRNQDIYRAEAFIQLGGLATVPEFMALFDEEGKPKG